MTMIVKVEEVSGQTISIIHTSYVYNNSYTNFICASLSSPDFEHMWKEGIEPNDTTFLVCFATWSRCKDV